MNDPVELSPHRVTKRFRAEAEGAGQREWHALKLLTRHAPGLAPAPLAAELGGTAPLITTTRLPGEPLRGRTQDGTAVNARAEATSSLHSALPPSVLARVPPRGAVDAAMRLGLRWLDGSGVEDSAASVREVFGAGDGNLANYLWDGARVRIVDFENSGRSDRAFELAEIIEHVGSWLRDCRRLLALVWLSLLSANGTGVPP